MRGTRSTAVAAAVLVVVATLAVVVSLRASSDGVLGGLRTAGTSELLQPAAGAPRAPAGRRA